MVTGEETRMRDLYWLRPDMRLTHDQCMALLLAYTELAASARVNTRRDADGTDRLIARTQARRARMLVAAFGERKQ